ncbi:diguanylate cyclase [Vibrio variabilis]|uniref:Diguanylate cyclase n=1 Tax=Vibrio variabilis TaxID=990271 RepID=A0ABQ0JJP5_9VIBR|nr:diguanylate cyclase [Vibrio variabilis]
MFPGGCFLRDTRFRVAPSIGVVAINEDNAHLTIDSLMTQADRAMYEAKKTNQCYYLYNHVLEELVERESLIKQTLISSLQGDGFQLNYMPIVCSRDKKLRGFEVLLRCPELTTFGIGPQEFIPFAERASIIKEIDMWVIGQAFKEIKSIQELGHSNLLFSINISSLELMSFDFPDKVKTLLNHYELEANKIEFEITETAFAPDDSRDLEVLFALKQLGFRLALDDFGTGFTSFNQLIRYPFDKLKIDKTFVDQILHDNPSKKRC